MLWQAAVAAQMQRIVIKKYRGANEFEMRAIQIVGLLVIWGVKICQWPFFASVRWLQLATAFICTVLYFVGQGYALYVCSIARHLCVESLSIFCPHPHISPNCTCCCVRYIYWKGEGRWTQKGRRGQFVCAEFRPLAVVQPHPTPPNMCSFLGVRSG